MNLGALLCWLTKHKRGRRDNTMPVLVGEQGYRCSRCGATWTRIVRPRKVKA